MDLISREAALDCFHDWIDRHGDVHTPDEMAEYIAIEELPPAQSEQRWIPCSERLPEDGQQVLIQMLFGKMSVIKFCATGLTAHIVAWMPLPAQYEERREDG